MFNGKVLTMYGRARDLGETKPISAQIGVATVQQDQRGLVVPNEPNFQGPRVDGIFPPAGNALRRHYEPGNRAKRTQFGARLKKG